MKFLKRMMVAALILGLICCPLRVAAISYDSIVVDCKQQEIDALLAELNELAAEEHVFLAMDESDFSSVTTNNTQRQKSINDRQACLENRLESLGVHTIDPNNATDMAQLAEVVLGNSTGNSTAAIPDPPDLAAIADCYTLSQHNGSVYVNGTKYDYSCIYVTDNKGYNRSPLTASQTSNVLVGKESTVLRDLLDYQFSFGFSSYLGMIPGGWLANWAIGSAFTVLNSLNENSTISYRGNNNIYNMSMISVTQMMYCYVFIPNADWELCGVKASNISYARAEYLVANIGGTAYSDAKNYPTVTSHTGISAASYVVNFMNGSGCDVDRIGSFTVSTYGGGSVRFRPGFAEYPVDLN